MAEKDPTQHDAVDLENLGELDAATAHAEVEAREPQGIVDIEDEAAMTAATEDMKVVELGVAEAEQAIQEFFAGQSAKE